MAFFTENCNVTHRLATDRQQTIRVCHSNMDIAINDEFDGDGIRNHLQDVDQLGSSLTSLNLSEGMAYTTESSSVDSSAAFKKIRYLNPATYIRPEHESFVDSESSRLLQEAEAEDGDAYISIPTLNLNAEAWSSNDLTYTHRKGDEKSSKEIIRKTEAFKEWLSAKIESENYAKSRKLKEDKQLQSAQAEDDRQRQIAREKKLREWFDRKKREAAEHLENLRLQQQEEVPKPTDPNESMRNYNAWLKKKLRYEQAVRSQQLKESEYRAKMDEMRRQKSAEQFNLWLAAAPSRPKPVPMNKGIYSLKGTISNLYMNPKPWVYEGVNHGGDDISF